jgi:hypothetical protein
MQRPRGGGVFELRIEGGMLDVNERAGEKGGVLEIFEEREGVREMKGEKKGRVEDSRREMKTEGGRKKAC